MMHKPFKDSLVNAGMLEEKIEKIKRITERILSRKELPEEECFNIVERLLLKKAVLKNPPVTLSEKVAVSAFISRLLYSLDIKEYTGVEKDYIALPETKLSEKAQKDIEEYFKIEEALRNYLRKHLKDSIISKKKFEGIVSYYLLNHSSISSLPEWRKSYFLGYLTGIFKKEFNITEPYRNLEKIL